MYHEAPVKVLLNNEVYSSFKKKGVIIWFASSTMWGLRHQPRGSRPSNMVA